MNEAPLKAKVSPQTPLGKNVDPCSGQTGPTFTPPKWDEVWFFISEQVNEDFPFQLRK